MELSFHTKALRDTCANAVMLKRKFAPEVVEAVRRVLADLRAASSVHEIAAGDVLGDVAAACLRIKLGSRHFLRLEPNHLPVPADANGQIDWTQVSRLKVMGIEAFDG